MATQAAFLRKTETPAGVETPVVRLEASRAERDPFQLRPLPHDDVVFFCKKIDNSRLVREADPRAGSRCWSVIGVGCLALAFLTGVIAPNVANTAAGYKLQALRDEAQSLANERRTLELQEALRLSPEHLDKLAQGRNLVPPTADQVIHVDNGDKLAVVK